MRTLNLFLYDKNDCELRINQILNNKRQNTF